MNTSLDTKTKQKEDCELIETDNNFQKKNISQGSKGIRQCRYMIIDTPMTIHKIVPVVD